jgi:cytochrome c biogenesis protein CcdA
MDDHERGPNGGRAPDQQQERAQPHASEPTGDVLRRLAADVATLAQVYGAEIRDHYQGLARDAARAALFIGAALALGFFALGLLVAAVVLVVAIWVPGWLAALIVLAVVVLAVAALVLVGIGRLRRRRTAWAVRVEEEVRWLRSLFPRES